MALVSLGLLSGCASDMWYKKGAGTDDLAEDKAACRAESAALQDLASLDAFETCMGARDWWHVTAPGTRTTPVKRTRKITVARTAPALTAAVTSIPEPMPAVPTPGSDAPTLPPVDAGLVQEEKVEIEETVYEPEPIDPKARQFWFKLGAGTDRLKSDQRECRIDIGLDAAAMEPSRWGQSDAFDTCMRGRGWGGGALR
jgi:hypothetical protein